MRGYSEDVWGSAEKLRAYFDCYCKRVIRNATHNVVFKETRQVVLRWKLIANYKMEESKSFPDLLFAERIIVDEKEVPIENEALARMLKRLSKRSREIIVMNFLMEMSLDEIASTLGISYESVKSAKSKAIREMRKKAGIADGKESV